MLKLRLFLAFPLSLNSAYVNLLSAVRVHVHCRHADREAEPKDYDVTRSDIDDRDLLRTTYGRIGNITDGVSQSVAGRNRV